MKYSYFLSFSLFFLVVPVFAEDDPTALQSPFLDYTKYLELSKQDCDLEGQDKEALWGGYKSYSFIKNISQTAYPRLESKEIEQYYTERMNQEKNPTSKEELSTAYGAMQMDNGFRVINLVGASYRATMNSIYMCAVLNVKRRVPDEIKKLTKDIQTETIRRFDEGIKKIDATMEANGCQKIPIADEVMLRKELLDTSTYQYCKYRYYLEHVRENVEYNFWNMRDLNAQIAGYKSAIEEQGGESTIRSSNQSIITPEQMKARIASIGLQVNNEIVRAKDVYPQALVAFRDFERTYAAHTVLLFIIDDYQQLRENLKNMISPISQFLYKQYNAQTKGPCS